MINKTTRITRQTPRAIDHIIANSRMHITFKLGIIKTNISHNFPIFFSCKYVKRQKTTRQPDKRRQQ